MTSATLRGPDDTDGASPHWRWNLAVCVAGSFSTIVAMTLLLPFLPLYVEQLGVHDPAQIVEWSGVAYGATFFTAALCAPLWGRLADRYGRKLMLIRASLGMAVAMSLIGMATSVWQLVALRLLAGLLGGYASGSNVLVATQTPKHRTGWALGVLASGIMAGNLAGPLIGGALPPLIGIRATFWLAGALIFVIFLATTFLIREERPVHAAASGKPPGAWSLVADKRPVVAMLATGMLLMFAVMSIEPIITVYVQTLVDDARRVTLVSGVVMSACALGSILSASWLGRLADRVGHWNVLTGGLVASALLLIPQAFVTAACARAARGRLLASRIFSGRGSWGLFLRRLEHLSPPPERRVSAGRLAMCRPRAVGGPLSGTGPARHRRPQTCRGAGETDPSFPCRGDRSWFEGVSVSRPIEGLDSCGAVVPLRTTVGRCQQRGRFASALNERLPRQDGQGSVAAKVLAHHDRAQRGQRLHADGQCKRKA
jgi:MFS family permease